MRKANSNKSTWKHRAAATLAVLLMFFAIAFGQATTSAQLGGTIHDATGAVVPEARLTITNEATNIAERTTSDQAGRYVFNDLRPATYTVTVEAAGFKTTVQAEIVLRVSQKTDLDFALELGDVSTRVEVQGSAPLLESASSSLSQEVDNRYVTQVPLLNRQMDGLVYLAPGVTQSNGSQGNFGTQFTSNGQRTATAEFRVDGTSITVPEYSEGGNLYLPIRPPVEDIQE